jgi:hypothetical protein
MRLWPKSVVLHFKLLWEFEMERALAWSTGSVDRGELDVHVLRIGQPFSAVCNVPKGAEEKSGAGER